MGHGHRRGPDAHHSHEQDGHHRSHAHLDRSALSSKEGIRCIKISTAGLAATAMVQGALVATTGSVALLADALHNFGDVFTTVGLWIAFNASRRAADRRYTYGFDRFEDLVGVIVVLAIASSAAFAGWESFKALLDPRPVSNLIATIGAGIAGVLGNEAVAQYKIKVGRRISSVALEADGRHSRTDGLASAGVVAGAIGIWLGFSRADAVAGVLITVMIGWVLVTASKDVFDRIVDRVDPGVVDSIERAARKVDPVREVDSVRARWAGRSLFVQLHIHVDAGLTVAVAHEISEQVRHQVFHDVDGVAQVTVHIDPYDPGGSAAYHAAAAHHEQGHADG